MNIYIKQLTLRNFKGIRSLTIPFTHETNIFGQNASGKTTVFDAFMWLLFGKDSTDRKDFNIKTLDKHNRAIHKLEHEVEGLISVDGVDISLKRIFREKWVTKRGEKDAEFSGHETDFFYNDVPMALAEYQEKVSNILKESIFKLITNALYFNQLKWQERRSSLMELAGNISDDIVIGGLKGSKKDKGYDNLLFILQSGKSLEEYKREIGAKKKIIKNEIVLIPSRIDEVERGMPEAADYGAIQKLIDKTQKEIEQVESAISNKNEAYQAAYELIREKQNTIHVHKTRRQAISFEIRQKNANAYAEVQQKRNQFTHKIETIEQDTRSKQNLLTSTKEKKEKFEANLAELRTQWATINSSELVFDANDFCCPACKRDFEPGDVEAQKELLKRNFMEHKTRKLDENKRHGLGSKTEIDACEKLINMLIEAIETLTKELVVQNEQLDLFEKANKFEAPTLDDQLAFNDEYVQLGAKIAGLESEVNTVPVVDDDELKAQRNALLLQRDGHKEKLNDKGVIERAKARIIELEGDEKRMAQEIANLEQTEFLVEDFTKAKMTIITERINGKFKYVSFKMFEQQVNGGEAECCETLINGVPFSDANNAARINAGIDIINALCDHYQVWAPIFIDNRESITELIPCKSQVVNLVVVKGAKLSVNEVEYLNMELSVA